MADFYNVTITNPAQNGQAAPYDGFIDPVGVESYITNLEAPPAGFTLAMSQAKRRANLRYNEIIGQLGMVSNTYIITAATQTPGASYNSEASSIFLQLWVEHGDSSMATADELNPGQYLTGMAAIARCIARALITNQSLNSAVFDPTPTTAPGNNTAVPRFGERIALLPIGPVSATLASASALISVTLIPT